MKIESSWPTWTEQSNEDCELLSPDGAKKTFGRNSQFSVKYSYFSCDPRLLTLYRQAPGVLPDLGQPGRGDPALQRRPRVLQAGSEHGGADQEAALYWALNTSD